MPTEQEYINYKDFVESLDEATPSANDKAVFNDANGPKGSVFSAIAAFVHNTFAAFVNALTVKTSFASGDKITVVNGNTATAMEASKFLELTAQNALAGNVAPAFVPNSTTTVAGQAYVYDGLLYVAKEDGYQGPWDANKFVTIPLVDSLFRTTGGNKLFSNFVVKSLAALNYKGEQGLVDLYGQILQVPKSNQWFNKDACIIFNGYLTGGVLTATSATRTAIFRIEAGKEYTISLPTGSYNRFSVAVGSVLPVAGTQLRNVDNSSTANGRSYFRFTTAANETYCAIYYFNANAGDADEAVIRGKLMCQKGTLPSTDYVSFELESLSFNTSVFKDYDLDVKSILAALEIKEVVDVTSSYDLAEIPLKYINKDTGVYVNASSLNISEAIPLNGFFAIADRTNVTASANVAYYYDEAGENYAGCDSAGHNAGLFFIYPRGGIKSFRLVTHSGAKLYSASLGVYENAVNEAVESIVKSFSVVVDEDVTESYPLSLSLSRIDPDTGEIKASSSGAASNPFPIVRSQNLCVTASDGAYHSFLAFYKDKDGIVPDKVIPVQGSGVVNYLVIPPVTAKSFRLASNNLSVYEVHTCHFASSGGTSPEVEQRLENVESDVSNLTDQVADLQESAMLSQVIDTVQAVKYKPERKLYLGADIFDFAELSYDPNVWSVDAENGSISYLGGSLDPIVMEVPTDNNGSYAFECTTSDYVYQTDMFRVAIGDGFQNDPYNGTNTIFCGAYSDGGYLKIVPKNVSNTFTLFGITFRKKVPWAQRVVEKTFECKDVNSGNGDAVALDAKWNVAIGPTANTQSKAANLSRSIAIGYAAQENLIGGLQNIAIGTFTQNLLKYALRNIAIGCDCLYAVTHADDCIALGKGCLCGVASQVNWNNPATWQYLTEIIAIGNGAASIANGQTATKSVYIGSKCGSDGIGNRNTIVGADGRGTHNRNNCTGVGYHVVHDKDNQAIFGNSDTTETKVFGNFIVEGTDHVKRKIVFNDDNTCSWEVVS